MIATEWSDRLWEEAATQAKGLDGAAVVKALEDTSVEVWEAGLDRAFDRLRAPSTEKQMRMETANAFDISWLTVFVLKLRAARK